MNTAKSLLLACVSTHARLGLGLALVVPLGCLQAPPPSANGAPAESDTGDTGTGGTTDDAESGAGDTTGTVLDVGDPGMPSDDCVAVTQTAETEMRPVDLIMVGDPETDQVLLRNAVTNLLPQLGKARGPDTRVVLIAGEAPPMGADPRWEGEFDCGEWDCRGASQFGYFRHIEVDLDPDAVLTEVMGLAPEWEQHMRTDTWKHIWISSSRGGDPSMSAEAFTTAFNAMGESYEQFTLHSLVTGPDPSGNFGELAVTSGGVFYHESLGGSVYSDFVEGVLEKLQGTPLSCEYSIPEPPAGQTFDPMRVNVEYEDDGELFALGYVEDAAACEDAGAGWYYDDPAAPTTIHVCPFTCGVFNTIESGSIEIVFGCATVPAG